MLVETKFHGFGDDPQLALVLSVIGDRNPIPKLAEDKDGKPIVGLYLIHHFSFAYTIGRGRFKEEYPKFEGSHFFPCCGVCDSPDQLLEKMPDEIRTGPRRFAVSLTPIVRSEQSPTGGWRWHKWGEYIGTQKPTREYLYDEPDIEKVYCFHVVELPQEG